MSVSSIQVIMNRIKSATPESPIAVFCYNGELNALFANTLWSASIMTETKAELIGIFNMHMDAHGIECRLRKATRLSESHV